MRHSWSISDSPDLPIQAFRKALGKNRPETLEGGKGGAPQAPNPWEASAAQTKMNQQTAAYNKALNLNNYTNPFGSQNSYITGYDPSGAPIYNTSISANPQLQSQLDSLLQQTGNSNQYIQDAIRGMGGAIGQYNNLNQNLAGLGSQYQGLQGQLSMDDVKRAQEQGQNAAYASQAQYLDPQFSQQQESLQAKLAAQGLAPGSQAYSNAMLNFGNERQRAYSNAQNQAIMTGSQLGAQNLQNQISGINTQAGLLGQQAGLSQQAGANIGQEAGLYGNIAGLGQVPYSQLSQIASMIPGYAGTGQAATNPADIMGAMNNQYQGQLGAYNAKQQSANATTSSLAGLAGVAAMMFF